MVTGHFYKYLFFKHKMGQKTTTDDFMSLIIQIKWSHYVILWAVYKK